MFIGKLYLYAVCTLGIHRDTKSKTYLRSKMARLIIFKRLSTCGISTRWCSSATQLLIVIFTIFLITDLRGSLVASFSRGFGLFPKEPLNKSYSRLVTNNKSSIDLLSRSFLAFATNADFLSFWKSAASEDFPRILRNIIHNLWIIKLNHNWASFKHALVWFKHIRVLF